MSYTLRLLYLRRFPYPTLQVFDTTPGTEDDLAIGRLDVAVSMSNRWRQWRRVPQETCYDSLQGVPINIVF